MRNLFVSLVLVFGGCSKDEGVHPDMSVPADLRAPRDIAGSFICDPVKQDCGAGMKCTYTIDPNNMMSLAQTCVAVSGNQGFEMPCDRNSPNGDPGDDTCAPGFFCSVIGWGGTLANPDRHCNQMCNTTADCPANHHCIGRSDGAGDCIRDCGMLGATTCGAGLACATPEQDISSTANNPIIFLTCRGVGTGGPADPCMEDAECADLLLCDVNEGTCSVRLCDDNHMCPLNTDMALSCNSFDGVNPLGVCQ
jgi:hypothetical protein